MWYQKLEVLCMVVVRDEGTFGHTCSLNKVMRLPAYGTICQHCGLALHGG